MAYRYDSSIVVGDGPNIDAFGRLRVSNPHTLFESQQQFDSSPLQYGEKITGTASSLHLPNESTTRMTVGTNAGDKIVRQTREYFRYQPGKSLLVLMTGVLGAKKAGVRQRIGYFDDRDGIFWEQTNSGMAVVRRTSTSGTAIDNTIPQSSWNLDKLDGSGPSGVNLDPSKTQILIIDFEWLGVGRVRIGFVIDGLPVYCHSFLHANFLTEVYMKTANLPCRYELENTSATASSTSMKHICSTVISEGGYNEKGVVVSAGGNLATKTVSSHIPLLSVRLKASHKTGKIVPITFDILNTANSILRYEVIARTILTGASWVSASAATELDSSATAVTGGIVIASGFITDREVKSLSLDSTLAICQDINGNTDILTIAAENVTSSGSVRTTLTWKEIY